MLPGVKRILYASDLREGSRPAFRAAVSLCGHYESHITYLHVIESAGTQAEKIVREMMARDASLRAMHDSCVQEVHDGIFQRVQAFCDTELDDDERLKPEQLDARVTEGEPWREILKAADDIHASVIVMGPRHDHSLGKVLIGSTAGKVIEHSQRPVLVVPLKH